MGIATGVMDGCQNSVPHVGVAVDDNDVERDALRILERIRPTWKKDSVRFKVRPVLFKTSRSTGCSGGAKALFQMSKRSIVSRLINVNFIDFVSES